MVARSALEIALATLIGFISVCYIYHIYLEHFTQEGYDKRVREIYQQIQVATGQSQDAEPLIIEEVGIENAYNDGFSVHVYRGLLDKTTSWDEVALILGHETAHGMLWHLRMPLGKMSDGQIDVLEANADKMGAFYMMKAGYNICKGRELFNYWAETHGDAQEQNHPTFSYRYAQLNINCD